MALELVFCSALVILALAFVPQRAFIYIDVHKNGSALKADPFYNTDYLFENFLEKQIANLQGFSVQFVLRYTTHSS